MNGQYELLRQAMEDLAQVDERAGRALHAVARAVDAWAAFDRMMRDREPDADLPRAWSSPRYRVSEGPVSVEAVVPLSLGEQPHDPADCFMHRGRPHLGACMDAEAYTRWYWLDGPGSRPFESTQIALATARLVAEAFQAKEEREAKQRERDALSAWVQSALPDEALPDLHERARQRGVGPDA